MQHLGDIQTQAEYCAQSLCTTSGFIFFEENDVLSSKEESNAVY